jgi:hypothetical protein
LLASPTVTVPLNEVMGLPELSSAVTVRPKGLPAVILSQAGVPDPLEQALSHQPVYDGRLTVREIQRTGELKAELVTLSACEVKSGPDVRKVGFKTPTVADVASNLPAGPALAW